ncbi:MAG TPA: tetratricopeptide repeat protein [Vicinamibacterales bacterium]|nr:tetratricopeptide repeat protein [Vicinamibacterales bacterium]
MEARAPASRVFRFGIFELDAASGELRRHGVKVRLADQPFQILLLLLERPREVVTREEVRQRLWTPDTTVDFDVGLNSAIRKLREALDDSAENPRFIETLPRRGYRFIGSLLPAPVADLPDVAASPAVAGAPRRRRASFVGGLLFVVPIAALTLISRTGWPPFSAETPAPAIGSIAVLPFENLTGDPARNYFSDAMTELLTTELVQAGGFDVIAVTPAMQDGGNRKSRAAVNHGLSVDALVAGAIVQSGEHVRITVRLIRAATDEHVWGSSFERRLTDAIGVEREMGRAIASAITGRSAALPSRAAVARTVSPQAYNAYMKGVAATGRETPEGWRAALAYFEDSVALQPDFAAAYSEMARVQLQSLYTGPLSPREVAPKAEASARKALELDDTLTEPHRTLGVILQNFYWRWEEGEQELRRAQAHRPNTERALKLDPHSFAAHVDAALVHRAAGEYERAVTRLLEALALSPGQPRVHFQLGVTLVFMGRTDEAIRELETAVESSRINARFQAYLGYAYAAAGRPRDARRIVEQLEARARQQYVSSFGLALIHDALGEKEAALAALERACEDRAVEFAQLYQYPRFKTIASEERFHAVMRRVGLPR